MSSLVVCKDCKKEISKNAKACPHCGAPVSRHTFLKFVMILLFVIWALNKITAGPEVYSPSSGTSVASQPAESAATANGGGWQYDEDQDEMASGKIKRAINTSTNAIEMDFPYGGQQHGRLILRKHPRYGKDVIFNVEKGQINCNSYDGCSVMVRFDDNPAQKFSANEPDDHSSETVFISNYTRFVTAAKKAKKISIEVSFFQQGNRVFTFDNTGLVWD